MGTKNLLIIALTTITIFGCKKETDKRISNKDNGKLQEVKSYLTERSLTDSLHAVILVGKDDTILIHEAFGYVDLDSIQKHTVETKVGFASLGKMFTAIAVMQLEAEGRINLNDLASKYLKDIETKTIRDSVRIEHLLSHTSGMGNYWAELRAGDESKGNNLDHVYTLVKNDTLLNPVGKQFGYSNSGFILLGKIIEEVSELSYREYVAKNVLDKCSMFQTELGGPAGGGVTTVADMWHFRKALKNGDLLAIEKLAMMTQDRSDGDYGYGFMIDNRNDTQAYGHNGGWWNGEKLGVAAYFFTIDNGYTVIALANRNPNVGSIGYDIHDILTKNSK